MTSTSPPPRPVALSVVLPAYRLGDVIADNLRQVLAALGDREAEVVVVDDGSPDRTGEEAARVAGEDPRVALHRHRHNQGKGEALVTGWRVARGEAVVFLDADLDLPPEQIPDLLPLLESADVVVGAKRHSMNGGRYPLLRRLLSRIFAASTSGLFRLPVEETQTGLKLFRREVLDEVLPQVRVRGYAFDLELLVRAHQAGYHIVEAPVRLGEGAAGASLRLGMMWELARDTLRIAWWTFTDGSMRGAKRR